MTINHIKKMIAFEAIKYIQPNTIVGVGTGSTINFFIDALATIKNNIIGAVSSSNISSLLLNKKGIKLFNLNKINNLDIYIDSADEINPQMEMIKGGGAALTKEKILAAAANKFICIADISKQVPILGKFPLPIEVITMARTFIMREIINIGGLPIYRKGLITDNSNIIIDVKNLCIKNAINLENYINNLPGVVTVGLFTRHNIADITLIGSQQGISIIKKHTIETKI